MRIHIALLSLVAAMIAVVLPAQAERWTRSVRPDLSDCVMEEEIRCDQDFSAATVTMRDRKRACGPSSLDRNTCAHKP